MKRFTTLGLVGLGLIALSAAGASPAAAKTKTKSYNLCTSAAVAIPDRPPNTAAGNLQPRPSASFAVPVIVPKVNGKPQDGVVTSFTAAGVRITHTFDSDLSLYLVSPGGRAITLAANRDQSPTGGNGYGAGAASCAGSLVNFGDLFPVSIATPGNTGNDQPITGSFRPEQSVGAFIGGPARGFWTLIAQDEVNVDVGAINALALNFTYQYKVANKKKKK
jgi:subtilisin-like proprotein convertase family protein